MLNQLYQEIQQFENSFKYRDQQVREILYSGQNVDLGGQYQPNPSLYSNSFFTENGEHIIKIYNSKLWRSLTYPGEYILLNSQSKIIQRIDYPKQLSATFDYRFCPVKTLASSIDVSEYFGLKTAFNNRVNQFINTEEGSLLARELGYSLSYWYLSFQMNNDTYQELLTQLQNIQIQEEKKHLLKYVFEFRMCLSLSYNAMSDLFTRTIRVFSTDQNHTKINIFSGCKHNVNIIGQNVYLDPDGFFENIQIVNSSNICLMGNQNVQLTDCNNVFIDKSSCNISLYNQEQCFFGREVGSLGGQIIINTYEKTGKQFVILKENSIMSSKMNVSGSKCIIAQLDSCQNSEIRLMSCYNSNIVFGERSCLFSQVLIQNSLFYGYLLVENDCIQNGFLKMPVACFHNGQCRVNVIRECSFPMGIIRFWFGRQLQKIYLQEGTIDVMSEFRSDFIVNSRKPQFIFSKEKKWFSYVEEQWGEIITDE